MFLETFSSDSSMIDTSIWLFKFFPCFPLSTLCSQDSLLDFILNIEMNKIIKTEKYFKSHHYHVGSFISKVYDTNFHTPSPNAWDTIGYFIP